MQKSMQIICRGMFLKVDYIVQIIIKRLNSQIKSHAKVAELVDALDLGFSAVRRESSSLSFRTISFRHEISPATS
jgi:hypothetical protein